MTQSKATSFRTRTGRIVWAGGGPNGGSLYDPRTTDFDGNPLGNDDKGNPIVSFEFGLAIKKQPGETHWANSPEGAVIWAQGHRDHPQAATSKDFSWKAIDGDSTEKSSKAKSRPCDKEGFPGHWVYTFRSGFPIKFVNADGSAYLLEKNAVKVGDYVQVYGSVLGNTGKSPGVYVNHSVVSLQGIGDAITTGPDAKALGFGSGPQPEGMLPVGSVKASSPPPPATSTPPPPAQVVQVPVTPAPGFVGTPSAPNGPPPATGVAPPPPPAQAAPPAGPQMTPKANGMGYASFIAAGWTDATLRANGYLV